MSTKEGITFNSAKFEKMLSDFAKKVPEKKTQALQEIIFDLAGASAELAPIESGDLRNACFGDIDDTCIFEHQSANGISVKSHRGVTTGRVSYEGLPYILSQHEDLTLNHDRTDGYVIRSGKNAGKTVNLVAGGQAKFLETPWRERLPRYRKRLRQILKDAKE